MNNILIIDDEPAILTALQFGLEDSFNVYCTLNVPEGIDMINAKNIDLVLLDQYLGEYHGLEVLQTIKKKNPEVLVIAMTAYGSIESSIEAIQNGAYYYITKPLDITGLKLLINKALDYKNLTNKVANLTKKISENSNKYNIVSSSKSMNEVFKIIDRIKDLDINVLITGESGTGKELIAKAIHDLSKRSSEPLEIINCAAIPHSLLESELFGYEKGAFTGANQRYKGKFELADKGTLVLDEIGEMDVFLQAKLLRVIQEKRITPLGSEKSIPVNFRLVASTNKNLLEEVKKGTFREDLFFRLNVISIEMPPLRKRKEDIPSLAKFFMNKYSSMFNKMVSGISSSAVGILEKYDYPGNVRELENIIERAVALTSDNIINVKDLPREIIEGVEISTTSEWIPIYIGESLAEAEKKLILATYRYCNENKRKTAKILGISERHIHTKLKNYLEEEKI
ncbi:acetoacetate metabolism regulatory protein AtoC [Gottschalkia purinilytica]|uniref:Acetoacetate metabolism regulatory protein AtoC n=1 Tax=Gottschalkia purinilytica TaxID=1503 RepID=A0A0L0W7R7_GOTPU|nr:sigma-54 dependent transcriptional regulator [Gottschalkia purinilytica]KNF07472.1 acetoacetate metabolism regulatory protein AtoC [Gottschalkia purinilytica]